MGPPSLLTEFPSAEAFDTIIEVQVGTGDDKRTFEVFKGVLCFYSGYFQAALNGRFAEAHDHIVKLPTEEPLVFELFRYWIHTRRFFEPVLEPHLLFDYATLAKLWIFGDAHHVPLLQNVVSDVLAEKMVTERKAPDAAVIDYIYENTVSKALLRKTVVEGVWLMMDANSSCTIFPSAEFNEWDVDDPANLKSILSEQKLTRPNAEKRVYWVYTRRCERHIHKDWQWCADMGSQPS